MPNLLQDTSERKVDVSVVLPCRDEEAALGNCITRIQEIFAEHRIAGEIIVSDSSQDSSPEIARALGAIVVKHDQVGYGRAYLEGFRQVRGQYVFCADPDGSYDFAEIPRFIEQLKQTPDTIVIGNRFSAPIAPGAMPWLHRRIGRPLFSYLFKIFFGMEVPDVHSGMRALRRETIDTLALRAPGMEFASEMLILAHKKNVPITTLPIRYYTRLGFSKLRSFRDGWRHMQCIAAHYLRHIA